MVSVREYWTSTTERFVEISSQTNGEALHSAGERLGILSLHDGVDVVALYRPVGDTKSISLTPANERVVEEPEHRLPPKTAHHVSSNLHRDMNRIA